MAYIDRELLLQDISDSVVFSVRSFDDPELRGAKKVIDRIIKAPTRDVEEVVRCKDCIHSQFSLDSLTYKCDRRGYFIETVKPTGFCDYGERRE